MSYARTTTIDSNPGGTTGKDGIIYLDSDLTNIFTHLNTHEALTTSAHGITSGQGTLAWTTGCTFTSPTISSGTITGAISATGATISGGTISGATITNTTLAGTTLSNPTLTGTVTASGATITGGTAVNMTIQAPTLTGTVTASGATVTGGTFANMTIQNPTVTGSVNLTAATVKGLILAAQQAAGTTSDNYISLDSTPDADYFASNCVISMTAASAMTYGDLACMGLTAGYAQLASATTSTTVPGLYICVSATVGSGTTGLYMRNGIAHLHTKAPGWAVSDKLFTGITAGTIVTQGWIAANLTTGNATNAIGMAMATDIIDFNPSFTVVEK